VRRCAKRLILLPTGDRREPFRNQGDITTLIEQSGRLLPDTDLRAEAETEQGHAHDGNPERCSTN